MDRHTTWKKVKRISGLDTLSVRHNDSMSGIISPCTSSADVGVRGKNVDELALAFVTPLGSEDDSHYISQKTSRQ